MRQRENTRMGKRIRKRLQEWIAVLTMVLTIGGGSYLITRGVDEGEPDFLEIGWWNIRDLSSQSRSDEEISQIALVIETLEVVAVGELNDPEALKRIAESLGTEWEWAATSNKIGRRAGTREYYGFLWNSEVVEMIDSVRVDPDPQDDFDREPAWATFRTLDGTLDFTLIAVHITWGTRVGPRKEEIRALAQVWDRTQRATPDDDDLVLVGDFNRKVGDDAFIPLLSLPGMVRANEETGPTNISSNTTYDQIFISREVTREWTGEYAVIAFDELFFDNNDALAKEAVSDHRPVWIRMRIPAQDDD